MTAEHILDLDLDPHYREVFRVDILDSVESIKEALSELTGKNQPIANA